MGPEGNKEKFEKKWNPCYWYPHKTSDGLCFVTAVAGFVKGFKDDTKIHLPVVFSKEAFGN